ncbi:uncharacterized protein TNCV_5138301 [Trichonephila clavipes]|nr:uncharacterized protein TNCV_5138301 [Trichonephila clavipes]
MPRSSGKVFKKRRGNFNQGRISNSESTVRSDSVRQQSSASNTGVFSEAVKCLQCGATGLNLSCEENCSGGAVELDIICDICSYSYNFCSSKKCKAEIGKPSTYEVNTRLVYAMRCIGKGREAARMFCGIMNLPPPPTKFSKYNKMLLGATKDVCDATMKDVVKEAVQENQNIRDIPVAVDGTWQKRGYSSMNGVVTVTSVDTGKVIDTEILFKHCVCKDKKKHGPVCKKNFNGYSGRMEVAGALSIFQRSVQRYDVRYTKYLGDGDSKAFDNIVKNEVYGDNCTITKLECIGHVMKRMGSRLRRFKAKMRGQKLSDCKALCGKNRLTEASIDQLQTYYGLAIRRNLSSVKDMRQGIWAIFLHKISTDENPQHGFCPSGPDTDLSDPEHGNTQNPNESINNVIWSSVPKNTFVHLETLSFGEDKSNDFVKLAHSTGENGAIAVNLKNLLLAHFYETTFVGSSSIYIHWCAKIKDEVEKLAYQLNEEAERTERPIRRLSNVMYGSTCADMQVDVMGERLSSIKHVVGLEEGHSVTSVAAEFGIAHSIVSRLWRQFQTTGTAIRGFSSGCPRGTTPADDRYIVLQARRNRRQTAGKIARHTTGPPISRFTVARRLHGGGLFARHPVRCVPLSPAHRRRRSL